AALADPGLAGEEEDRARAGPHLVDRLRREHELVLAADERRLGLCAPGSRGRLHAECGDGVGLALEGEVLALGPRELALGEPLRLGAGEDPVRGGSRLQPGGDVDRVAGRAVLDAAAGADRAD